MRVLSKINPELQEILDWWKDWIFSVDVEANAKTGRNGPHDAEYGTSIEYLKELQSTLHIGFPECSKGLSL